MMRSYVADERKFKYFIIKCMNTSRLPRIVKEISITFIQSSQEIRNEKKNIIQIAEQRNMLTPCIFFDERHLQHKRSINHIAPQYTGTVSRLSTRHIYV